MKDLILIISPRIDDFNSLLTKITYLSSQDTIYPALKKLDDAHLIGDSAILVDRSKDHAIYVQLCAGLDAGGVPYLIVPMDVESVVVAGKFPETTKSILEKYIFS